MSNKQGPQQTLHYAIILHSASHCTAPKPWSNIQSDMPSSSFVHACYNQYQNTQYEQTPYSVKCPLVLCSVKDNAITHHATGSVLSISARMV